MSQIESLESGLAADVINLVKKLMQSNGTIYGIEAIYTYEVTNPDPYLLVDNRGFSGQKLLQECLDFVLDLSTKYGDDGVTFVVTYKA